MAPSELYARLCHAFSSLGFKFRSKFTAHCGRGIIGGNSGEIISRYASHHAGPSCFSGRLLVKCVAADVESLHVDMTVQDYQRATRTDRLPIIHLGGPALMPPVIR